MSSSQAQLSRIGSTRVSGQRTQSIHLKLLKEQKVIQKQHHQTFHKLKRNATNLFNENLYFDDHFKLQQLKPTQGFNRKVSICRLKDIFPVGTLLFGEQINLNHNKLHEKILPHCPNFICEMHVLPFWHYQTLIEPKYINEKGFYHVVVWKDGRLIKQTIDDTFYYDQAFKTLYTQFPQFKTYIWMHIILKVWAKCKGGYNQILKAEPFEFVKTFSYPDWKVINPTLQDIQKLIANMNPIQRSQMIAITQTKDDQSVGLFGLIPNSAAYVIIGHYMEFQAVFVKIKSLNGSKWNGLRSIQNGPKPQDEIELNENQFIIPIKQFTNLFHLIHVTSNKFEVKEDIFYTRYTLNLDARQSKAKMILIEVNNPPTATESTMQKQPKEIHYTVNLTVYFPSINAYDLNRQKNETSNEQFKIPFCKLMIGRQQETTNLEASFVQSMKQKMLENEDGDFLYGKASIQYEWIQGTYFKGYDNTCTFLMKLMPGRYFLRFKLETLRVEYRANINIVSSTHVKISDPKMDKNEQQQFLTQILSSKARLQKRNIGYLNPIKKGSWYICNNDFKSIGYGYLVIQTTKTSEYQIELRVDPKMLRSSGYRLKSKKEQNKYMMCLKEGEGYTLVFKVQDGFQDTKERIWPPHGIQITRIMRN